jgi:topoisomerase-4 subunit A
MADDLVDMNEGFGGEETENGGGLTEARPISGLYEDWFLDYASYVILERAVPAIEDGLKPVQRRILHAMEVIDEGRFNKVANLIGQTMQYHPHGDAAIGEALVGLGQKDLLIETQGNWGDVRTGDSAAAPRYIEARLSKFAKEVAFHAPTTEWQMSYDGRKKEPVTLPIKFPLLLAQGVEGIAVGLSTRILPHNFVELLDAGIKILRKQSIELYPDFPTGGLVDVSAYQDGRRGGRIRCRARIEERDKKTLIIKEIPFGTTTGGIMESIVKASEANKIKVKKVVDNTARDVEIEVQLQPGVSPDITMDALYAFTDCEVSIAPNCCVIADNKPDFLGVSDLLRQNVHQTMHLLKRELEIRLEELEEDWHFSSLEKIFIEQRIYRNIEECETWEAVIQTIFEGLKPFIPLLRRTVTEEDVARLTEIKIKRISKFDAFKADEHIRGVEQNMEQVGHDLQHLVAYTISYYEKLLKKYGGGRVRKSEIRVFDSIQAVQVAVASERLYVNRADGFVGYSLKKDEYVTDCSPLDEIIVIRRDGKMIVTRVSEKGFVGKDVLHVDVFRRADDRLTFHLMYLDGENGTVYAKRFQPGGVTRDKEYELTRGSKGSKVLYLSANPNSESEVVQVFLSPASRAKKKVFDFDFAELDIRSRSTQGNILTRYPVKRVLFRERGASTLGGRQVWYDETTGRLNVDARGRLLGSFDSGDAILAVYKEGTYELTSSDLTHRFVPEQLLFLEKWISGRPISVVHFVAAQKATYVKRFLIETATLDKRFSFISESAGSKLLFADSRGDLVVEYVVGKGKKAQSSMVSLSEFIDVKGWKAVGNRLVSDLPVSVRLVSFSSPEDHSLPDTAGFGNSILVEGNNGGSPPANGVAGHSSSDSQESAEGGTKTDGAPNFGQDSHEGVVQPNPGIIEEMGNGQDSADNNRLGIPRQLGLFD